VRQLDPALLAVGVFEALKDVSVQIVQEIESADDLAGTIKVLQPFLQRRAVVRIAGKAIWNQLHLLFRRVLEREGARGRLDQAFDGIVVIKVYVHFAQDTQLLGRLRKRQNGDGVAVDVAQPTH